MRRKPVIDPQTVRDFEDKIAQELLRHVPGPEAPDEIDVRDAYVIAPLIKKFDWPAIQRFGLWLFSDEGWPNGTFRQGPHNDVLGRLRVLLRQVGDEES